MNATVTTPITPKQFAEALNLSWKIREASFDKKKGYLKSEQTAVEEAVTQLGMNMAWVLPIYILMSTGLGVVGDWAEEYAK